MAGSLTWRQYKSDTGAVYSVACDKSNANCQTNLTRSGAIMPPRISNLPSLPIGLEMRFYYAISQSAPNKKRKFYIGDLLFVLPGSITGTDYIIEFTGNVPGVGVELWLITGYVGERWRDIPRFAGEIDSGLSDGAPGSQ